jgi:hypothetical protein
VADETESRADRLWTPAPERIERANITRFARERGLPEDYGALWEWSVGDWRDSGP